jgi:hypothetical protein
MKAFKLLALALVLVFCASSLRAEDWRTGTLLTFNTHQETRLDEGTTKNAGISCYLKVDVGDRILFVKHRISYIFEHTPQLTENAPIRWHPEKGKFIYLDDNGRKYKADVAKTRMK